VTLPSSVVVAYTASPRTDAVIGIEDPAPDGRLKDELKKAIDIQTKKAKLASELAFMKLTGTITSILAVDANASMLFDSSTLDYGPAGYVNPSHAFVTWLLSMFPRAFSVTGEGSRGVWLYGFDTKSFARVSGIEAIEANVQRKTGLRVPIGYWYANTDAYDPFEMLVEAEVRRPKENGSYGPVSMQKLLTRAGLTTLPELLFDGGGYSAHINLKEDLRLTLELANRFQLFPVPQADDIMAALLPS